MIKLALMSAGSALIFFVTHWLHPEFAVFALAMLPVVLMGINMILLLVFLSRCEMDDSISLLHTLEVSVYTLMLTTCGSMFSGQALLLQASENVTIPFVVFITVAAFLVGLIIGICILVSDVNLWGESSSPD